MNRRLRQDTTGPDFFASAIAHECRNILTPAATWIQRALETPGDQQLAVKTLSTALAGIQSALAVAEEILELSTPGREPARKVAQVPLVVTDAVHLAEVDADIQIDIPAGILASIAPEALKHVLLNLLLNARQASGGKGTIQVRVQHRVSSTWNMPVMLLTVEDQGCGFREAPDRILSSSRSQLRGAKRHGLGLAICRMLVERAGGRFEIASREGVGTVVTVTLPMVQSSAQAA